MGTYHRGVDVVAPSRAQQTAERLHMPEQVTVAMEELAGACREGLLALAVGTGLRVMHAIIEESVTAVAGPKGKHDPARQATRHGQEDGAVTLGGRRVPVRRPRVRTVDGSAEVALPAYDLFASRDLLGRMAVERMLAGLSTRRYGVGLEPVGSEVEAVATGTTKSAVSRRCVALTRTALGELMTRPLHELRPLVLMIDGVHVADHLCVVALVIDAEGKKTPVGLVEGATENSTVVTGLLEDLVSRGLDLSGGVLVVMDGARALAAAVRRVLGKRALVHRCQEHKIRNVLDHLPKEQHGFAERKLRAAYARDDADRAERELTALAKTLERPYPGAAASLREGLAETLTVSRLQLSPALRRTLRSTNPIESMIGSCRTTARNVKRYRDGEMALRWVAAGMTEAQKHFRRIKGFRDLPVLACALARHDELVSVDKNTKAA
jgi:transposase-like protein